MFTLPTGVPAFQRAGGLPAVRWRDAMTRTSRNVTVGLIVTLGLAGVGRTASAEPAPIADGYPDQASPGPSERRSRSNTTNSFGGAGLESDLHRHAHCDEYGELLQSAARGDRSHGDLRRVQRHRTALHADLRSRTGRPTARRAERRSSLRRTRRWSACSRPDRRRSMPAMRLRWRR